jgi:lipopolysaccharide export system protein LptC
MVLLENPKGDITLKNGTRLAAEAEKGTYSQQTEKLLLEGHVRLFHDDGYELVTEKMLVDMQSQQAWSDREVSGQGPAGSIKATGLEADMGKGKLIFTGPVKLVLNRSIGGI